MILYYFLSALILSLGVLLIKKRNIAKSLMVIFVLLQLLFNFYAIVHKDETDLTYFRYDALGLIFITIQHLSASSQPLPGLIWPAKSLLCGY